MRAGTRFTSFLIFFAVFFPAGTRAQSTPPQGQASVLVCRPWEKQSAYYKNGGVYIAPNESIVGDSICHVEAKSSAPAPAPAVTSPVTSILPPQPAPTPAPARVEAVQPPQPAPPKPEPRADRKRRIFVTDSMIDEQTFVARKSSRASASGQSSASLNGSWDRNGGSVNGSANGSFQASGNSQAAEFGFTQHGNDPRTVEVYSLIYKECSAKAVVTDDPGKADFILVFRRQDGKRSSMFAFGGLTGLALSANMKLNGAALFSTESGDMTFATEEKSVRGTIKKVCAQVTQ